jgi:mono/diheme cytochrome c family protein
MAASGDAAKGKQLYTQKCAACHAAGGEGKEAIAKMFKVTLKNLGSKEVQDKSDANLAKGIDEGVGKMKPVKLTPAEAADVIAFVRTLKK